MQQRKLSGSPLNVLIILDLVWFKETMGKDSKPGHYHMAKSPLYDCLNVWRTHYMLRGASREASSALSNKLISSYNRNVLRVFDWLSNVSFVRSSETVRLIDLLDEAKVRMRDSLNTRNIEGKTNLSSEDMARAAEIIGYGAVKYFDLKQNPSTNYVFSYDRMLGKNMCEYDLFCPNLLFAAQTRNQTTWLILINL